MYVTNAFQLSFLGKVYCEACYGRHVFRVDPYYLVSITILNDIQVR